MTILTSVGYRQLEAEQYIEAIQKLQPDIAVGLSDLSSKPPGVKRRERMVDRTHAWTRDAVDRLYNPQGEKQTKSLFFAPLLPLDKEQQMLYIEDLQDEMSQNVAGLALYDIHSSSVIPESMSALVRLSLGETKTPREILKEVSLGIDLSTVPFVGDASDAGIALDFIFPSLASDAEAGLRPLGIDMWSATHAADISPLLQGCECYTCQKFTRAYIRHLLHAKEMLAWTLLQIHNYQVLDNFYAAIRDSIAKGTFYEEATKFELVYEPELPQQSGQGPRYVTDRLFFNFRPPGVHPPLLGNLCPDTNNLGIVLDYVDINLKAKQVLSRRIRRYMGVWTMLQALSHNRSPRLPLQTLIPMSCKTKVSRQRRSDWTRIPRFLIIHQVTNPVNFYRPVRPRLDVRGRERKSKFLTIHGCQICLKYT